MAAAAVRIRVPLSSVRVFTRVAIHHGLRGEKAARSVSPSAGRPGGRAAGRPPAGEGRWAPALPAPPRAHTDASGVRVTLGNLTLYSQTHIDSSTRGVLASGKFDSQ
ncbi:hypothetical protein AMYX_12500 [Anaeromyxobacter diazotrophicus]|uniref:Uncharacterized protein n=1 Tax=Anaeromyxobacter diazotrophicus TaxID=2590199 RepID=A0A7I9VJZ4_9BACT|nr:hypothetical protein AMYX_12500 [Anaeromyxobacter diazotrophicus]